MTDTTDTTGSGDSNLERLREKAARADELEAKVMTMEKNAAFKDAGIDVSEGKPGKLLFDSFAPGEGGFTSDAVLAYATQHGMAPAAAVPPTPEGEAEPPSGAPIAENEQQFFKDAGHIAGGVDATKLEANPIEDSYKTFTAQMTEGGSTRKVAATAAMQDIFKGAAAGDQRVLLNDAKWREDNA